jgi:hypothetical protein
MVILAKGNIPACQSLQLALRILTYARNWRAEVLLASATSCSDAENDSKNGDYGLAILVNELSGAVAANKEDVSELGRTFFRGLFCLVVLLLVYAGLKRFGATDEPST